MQRSDRLLCLRWLPCLLVMAAVTPARALDAVPFAGLRFGGDLSNSADTANSQSLTIDSAASYGGIVDVPLPVSEFGLQAIELYYSRQQTTLQSSALLSPPVADLTVSVLQVGVVGTVPTDEPRLSWLLIGAGGATRFSTSAGTDTRPSLSIGGAVRWMASEHVGLRADLRAIVDFTGSNGSVLACNGGCRFYYSGTIVAQGEVGLGVVVRF